MAGAAWGDVHGRGMHGKEVCMVGGHAWQRGVHGRRVCIAGACMTGGGASVPGKTPTAANWNAFLFCKTFVSVRFDGVCAR